MTEQEAINCLMADKEYLTDMKVCDGEEMDIAIKSLEEVKQYRAIGTVEDCRAAVEKQKKIRNKAIDDFAELLKGNLIRKYAKANITQQYVALQVTDWCNEIAEQLKGGGANA